MGLLLWNNVDFQITLIFISDCQRSIMKSDFKCQLFIIANLYIFMNWFIESTEVLTLSLLCYLWKQTTSVIDCFRNLVIQASSFDILDIFVAFQMLHLCYLSINFSHKMFSFLAANRIFHSCLRCQVQVIELKTLKNQWL